MNEYFNKLGSWNLPKPGATTLECPAPKPAPGLRTFRVFSRPGSAFLWRHHEAPPSTAVTYKVTSGNAHVIDEGEIYSQSLPNGPAIVGEFRDHRCRKSNLDQFQLEQRAAIPVHGRIVHHHGLGSATFSVSLAGTKSYVTNFSLYNASIYTQSGFVTPAGTPAASKAPGNVPIANSPTINLATDTTKPWTLTPNVGYDLTDPVPLTVEGLI